MTGDLIKRRKFGDALTQREIGRKRQKLEQCSYISQGMSRIASNQQKLGRAKEGFFL